MKRGQIFPLNTLSAHSWAAEEEAHSHHYLAHLLLLALIPAVCLFIGTTDVGWSLAENETVKLSTRSALQLCSFLYVTILVGVALMGQFIRWMSRTFDARPTVNQCMSQFPDSCRLPTVGANLLAMAVNGNACLLAKRGAFESIASKLAPTVALALRPDAGLSGFPRSASTTVISWPTK